MLLKPGRRPKTALAATVPIRLRSLKHIEEQDEIGTIFRLVSEDVYETTRHTQLPELSLSIIGRFYLHGKIEVSVKPGVPASPAASAPVDTTRPSSLAPQQQATLPGQDQPPVNGSSASATVFPPIQGAVTTPPYPQRQATLANILGVTTPPYASDECMREFSPLRDEAEKRGQLAKAASERHAPADEACKLIDNFGQAEIKMIKYVDSHATKCGIPPRVADQLKTNHGNTEALQRTVCTVAQQMRRRASKN
jgi:hypothetical protein